MAIAIDIDGVISHTVESLFSVAGLPEGDITDWHMSEWYKEDRSDFINNMFDVGGVFDNAKPDLNAVEVLNELDSEGVKMWYITSRNKNHKKRTEKWLRDNGFPNWSYLKCTENGSKFKLLVESFYLTCFDFIVEDKPQTIMEFAKHINSGQVPFVARPIMMLRPWNSYLAFSNLYKVWRQHYDVAISWWHIKQIVLENEHNKDKNKE